MVLAMSFRKRETPLSLSSRRMCMSVLRALLLSMAPCVPPILDSERAAASIFFFLLEGESVVPLSSLSLEAARTRLLPP